MEESMSRQFDFGDVARKSVSSRKFVSSIKPQNGNSFTLGGQVIEIALPTAQARTFAHLNDAYLKFRVTNNNGATFNFDGTAGAACVINRCQIQSSGGVISDIANYNVLYSALMDLGADPATSGNVLSPLMGTNQGAAEVTATVNAADCAFQGVPIAAGASRTVVVPLVMNPFSSSERGVYLGTSDSVRFRFTLEEAVTALIGAATNAEVAIDEVSLMCPMTTLSEEAYGMIEAMTGGVFSILSTDWRCVAGNVAAGVSSATNIIGVSVSSAKRILILPRNTADVTDADGASLANRTLMNISQLQLNASGRLIPEVPITIEPAADTGRGAMALAALLQSDDKLGDIKAGGLFGLGAAAGTELYVVNTAAAATDATAGGKFMAGVDLRSHPDGDDVFSGLNLLGANFLAQYTMNVATTLATTVLYCVSFHSLISCDTRGSNTWKVSV
jgi:hypothetical protein